MRFAAGPLAVTITASDDALARAAAANFQCPPAAPDAEPLDVVCRRLEDGRIEMTARAGAMVVQDLAELRNAVHAVVQDAVARACADRAALHAAACVAPNGRALLVAGASGVGKSSSAVSLAVQGWRCLTDDLAFVHLERAAVNGCDPALRLDAPWPLGPLPPGWEHACHESAGIDGAVLRHHHYRPPRPDSAGPWSVSIGAIVFPARGSVDAVKPLSAGEALQRFWPQRLTLRHVRALEAPKELAALLARVPAAEIQSSSVSAIGPNLMRWWDATTCGD